MVRFPANEIKVLYKIFVRVHQNICKASTIMAAKLQYIFIFISRLRISQNCKERLAFFQWTVVSSVDRRLNSNVLDNVLSRLAYYQSMQLWAANSECTPYLRYVLKISIFWYVFVAVYLLFRQQ